MTSISASEAKQKFGQLIDKAQHTPVQIVRHGRSIAYVISDEDFQENEIKKTEWLEMTLAKAKSEFEDGKGIPEEEVYANLRKKLFRSHK